MHPSVAVVIPVRNGGATIGRQLDALQASRPVDVELEIVIADNGSTDDTLPIVESFQGQLPIRVIDASGATGINVARNAGVRASAATWVLLCDADDEVDPSWLATMVDAFERGGVLLGGTLDYRRLNPAVVRSWRGADLAAPQLIGGFMPSAHGANCGFTRHVFDEIGGFDEAFAGGGDDIEFFWRAQLAGHPLTIVDNAVVHYRLRDDLTGLWRQFSNYGRSEVNLFRAFRARGMPRRRLRSAALDVWWLLSRAPFAYPLPRRGAWLRRLAVLTGRLRGAIEFRQLWL